METFTEGASAKRGVLQYGSSIYLNFLDLNGFIYFATAEGIKSPVVNLIPEKDFFKTNHEERGLFKILPRFVCSSFAAAKNKYTQLQEEKSLTGFALQNSRRESNIESGTILKEMYDELDDNLEILKKNNGTDVKFGSQVQFLHVDSQKFMSFMPHKSSIIEPDNLGVELSDEFSDLTVFKLLAVFNYQANNNGLILDNDEVYIMNCTESTKGAYEPYLNASKTQGSSD